MASDSMIMSIVDSNDVEIDFGTESISSSVLMIADAAPGISFLNKCEYITAVNGIALELDSNGKQKPKTYLNTGKFAVNQRQFITQFSSWYTLKRIGREWYSENKPASAAWIKQRIQAALLPFGISQKEMTAIYQLLLVSCISSDAVAQPLSIVTAEDLNTKVYNKPPFIVSGFLCAGLTLLAAPPKTGKSFLALDLACCVADGKPFWGFETKQGHVLYCDLEGTEWRTQDRLPIVGRASKNDCPAALAMVYRVNAVDAGLVDQLTGWIDSVSDPRLIIIDTLAHVKGRVARGEDAYTADTRFMKPLHDLAVSKGIAILAITHTRKANGFLLDDPFDAVIGSTAQYGNSDAGWIIGGKRDEDKKQFTAVGRDFEPVSLAIERSKTGRWLCNGTTEAVQARTQLSEYRQDQIVRFILDYLPKCGGRWTCSAQEFINESAAETGKFLATDPTRLSKRIRELAPQLLENDSIVVHLPEGNGRKGRKFTFEQKTFTN